MVFIFSIIASRWNVRFRALTLKLSQQFYVFAIQSGWERIVHYLDDFLSIGPSESSFCLNLLNKSKEIPDYFGVPLEEEKNAHPCTTIEFLGILIDTSLMEFRLPLQKN